MATSEDESTLVDDSTKKLTTLLHCTNILEKHIKAVIQQKEYGGEASA